MSKILVEVLLPAADKKFDVYIPLESRMSEVKTLISAALSELSDGNFLGDSTSLLCDAQTGMIYNINMIVADLGIKSGTKLMLI